MCAAALLACAAGGGELVIRAADFPVKIGGRATFALATADGQPRGQVRAALVGSRRLGKAVLVRQAVAFGQMRVADGWLAKSEERVALYASFAFMRMTFASIPII